MPPCKHHEICGRDALGGPEGDALCILHSEDPEKDKKAFWVAFEEHRGKYGDKFSRFVFAESVDFHKSKFNEADFSAVRFTSGANFSESKFEGRTNFRAANFGEMTIFEWTLFVYWADFHGAQFGGVALFTRSKFARTADFMDAHFDNRASFSGCEFEAEADFVGTHFTGRGDFLSTEFGGGARFEHSQFGAGANFMGAEFSRAASFGATHFNLMADFTSTHFNREAEFGFAGFSGEVRFWGTRFTEKADFHHGHFHGRTLFFGANKNNRIVTVFSDVQVDFRHAILERPDALSIRDADLGKCRFLGTDLRKAEITGAKWPKIGRRFGVYDEVVLLEKGETRAWSHIERLYRELKQNYEDRKDYERAGDFHYGEKEMRRKNPDTSWGLWFVLSAYWLVSGYGERWVRPLLWLAGLLVISTIGYLWFGLSLKGSSAALMWWTGLDLATALEYSMRVMTLLKPDNLVPVGWSRAVNLVQSLLGPVLIGLFALALRQRLRR